MKPRAFTAIIAASAAIAALSACDRPREGVAYKPGDARSEVPTARNERDTPATPIERAKPHMPPGPPTAAEKREGANPVQGQVDPKQTEQRRDFKHPQAGG